MNEPASRPLTVCMLVESYFPVVGGMETQARNIAKALVEEGVKVIFVTRRPSASVPKNDTVDNARVWRCSPTSSKTRFRWALCVTSIPILFAWRRDYDIILVPGFRALGLTAVLMGWLLRKPCILKAESSGEMSGTFFGAGLARAGLSLGSRLVRAVMRLRNNVLAHADAFVSMSSDMSAEFISAGIAESQIHVIPQTVDTDRFSPAPVTRRLELRRRLGLPEDDIIVVYTGRLVSYKGILVLAHAWPSIHRAHPRTTLVFVGEGSADIFNCEQELHNVVREHGLQDSVTFAGAVGNVEEYLQASDILAFPTENEAFGISLIEGMACGLAPVSTTVGGVKDILDDERNGLAIEAGNEAQLREALLRLIEDEGLRKALGEEAVLTVRTRYTWKIVSGLYIDLFKACLDKGTAR
ncbi:MAG: glycosyltransferase family 4 protein [Deltaproteobacteria bacterium]|nr:glycosyltransferase family 4 protein [Deltaproteobacteria bacterium]